MKEVVLSYATPIVESFDIDRLPQKWQIYFNACQKDTDELTDEEWEIISANDLEDFLAEMGKTLAVNSDIYIDDIV